MKMPNKQQLDKAAWDWATSINPQAISQDNIETAYRLKLKRCKVGCRRNCKGNPYCLSNLGEKTWMQDITDDSWHEIDDQNSERRLPNTFVGLKNLGATCYVNSFLQVWFHNPAFRKAIYCWKPQEDPQEKAAFSEDGSFKPVSFVGHLQLLFVQLQFSSRRYIDPSSFINVLGLNATMQQDAQEFRQLFISLLEKKLSNQHDEFVRNIINTQYSGECAYVTRCHRCSTESTSSSRFYDLDLNIKGHKELGECLDEFLQEERLDGPNQYSCNVCQSKQNATRSIRLLRLPPVLHLQLLRFYFEKQARCKKKLNSFIRFPEVLDMSKYLNRPNNVPENTVVYELSGVLIHRGPSAYSGHYIAHIKDRISATWYKFNDETVEKMEGKKLHLGTEENLELPIEEGPSKTALKPTKATKGLHSSNNAYMLVYKLRNPQQTEEEIPDSALMKWDVPSYLQQAVLEDNSNFEEWVKELDDQRAQNLATSKAKQLEIRSLYEKLPFAEGEEYEWVPSSWLSKWLSSDHGTVPSVDNSFYLCQHGKLNPDDTGKLKCISSAAANEIFEKYGGGPRLRDYQCRKCVETRCQIVRVKNKVFEDHKLITAFLKPKVSELSESAFWIGKLSLRTWRRQVLCQYEDVQQDAPNADEVGDYEASPSLSSAVTENTDIAIIDDQGEEPTVLFNEDLLCEHRNMIFDENQRRLIPAEAWSLLKQYFPDPPEFPYFATPCSVCQAQIAEDKQTKDVHKMLSQEQKMNLSDLYLDKNRPIVSKLEPGTVLFAVSQHFVDEWRKFVKDSSRRFPVSEIRNNDLLCSHGKLDHILDLSPQPESQNCLVFVWTQEWFSINQHFIVDQEIEVTCTFDEKGALILNSLPEVCESCSLSRLQAQERQRLEYSNAKIYIRRVTKTDDVRACLPEAGGGPASSVFNISDDLDDPVEKIKKRRLMEEVVVVDCDGGDTPAETPSVPAADAPATTAQPPREPQLAVRRSNRRRPQRGEKTMTVSSDDKLRDLKLQIMKTFHVAPFDQHLTLNDQPLTDTQATLASLGVSPGALLLLTVDVQGDEVMDIEDYAKASVPETGFKGTELLN